MNDEVMRHWEDRYGSTDDAVWSGRVNATVAAVAADLVPGRAVDLGCGEGGDVVWLAGRGWTVTGVDISGTAIGRGQLAAERAGVAAEVSWVVADLETWSGIGPVDLVAASFLHSTVHLDRTTILNRATDWIVPGGHLLIVAHAAPPPWASPEHVRHFSALTPQEEADQLALAERDWSVEIAETRERTAWSPEGDEATLLDGVLLLRRR